MNKEEIIDGVEGMGRRKRGAMQVSGVTKNLIVTSMHNEIVRMLCSARNGGVILRGGLSRRGGEDAFSLHCPGGWERSVIIGRKS